MGETPRRDRYVSLPSTIKSIWSTGLARQAVWLRFCIPVLAMVLAGPTHLFLAHGNGHEGVQHASLVSTDGVRPVHEGCHGHQCQDHGKGETDQEDSPNPPCDSPAGDCDTCVVLNATTPVDLGGPSMPDRLLVIDVAASGDERPQYVRRDSTRRTRGPPRLG